MPSISYASALVIRIFGKVRSSAELCTRSCRVCAICAPISALHLTRFVVSSFVDANYGSDGENVFISASLLEVSFRGRNLPLEVVG